MRAAHGVASWKWNPWAVWMITGTPASRPARRPISPGMAQCVWTTSAWV